MCVSVLATSTFASDNFTMSGATVTKYEGTSSTVTVPSTNGGTTVTTISADTFVGCDFVTLVYLPSTITTVEAGAFANCSDDVKVVLDMASPSATLPSGMENWGVQNTQGTITYYTTGGQTTMTLSNASSISGSTGGSSDNNATTYAYIKDGTVSDLGSPYYYEKIVYTNQSEPLIDYTDVSKDGDESVKMYVDSQTLYFWFDGDELMMPENMTHYYAVEPFASIEGLTLLNTSQVTTMSGMFDEAHQITEMDLSSFDTSKVTSISTMFVGCTGLVTLDLSSFDIANIPDKNNVITTFSNDSLETVYVRSQADIDILKPMTNANVLKK